MSDPQETSSSARDQPRRRSLRELLAAQGGVAVRHARRVIVLVVGTTVVAIGVVMLVTPGPALVMIPLGLGILAVEFAWARRLLKRIKDHPRNPFASKPDDARAPDRNDR